MNERKELVGFIVNVGSGGSVGPDGVGSTAERIVLKCGGPTIADQCHKAISRVVLVGNLNPDAYFANCQGLLLLILCSSWGFSAEPNV
ncbi:MAG: hypothetical protein M5U15_14320 [Kiritimatiellae bacterium]|nr:hypothetical protein [Kiritimatiellia bacterium]